MSSSVAQSPESRPVMEYLRLDDASWGLYEAVLRETGDRPLRITYHQGRMEIMSPSPRHERRKMILGSFVEIIALERRIPMRRLGSTTFRRQDLLVGLEPDQCYYVQSQPRIGNREDLNFEIDPPPDLAIEVDVAYRSIAREPVYAALGVNEIWRHDGLNLSFRKLNDLGNQYEVVEASLAFPVLFSADLNRFLSALDYEEETIVLCNFRDWVRKHV
jgi:Uma2 family endonuclease